MSKNGLNKALARLKKANEKVAQMKKECDSVRAEWQPLTQISAEVKKIQLELNEALDKWHEVDAQFSNDHAQLFDAIIEARNERNEADACVKKLIRELTGAEND